MEFSLYESFLPAAQRLGHVEVFVVLGKTFFKFTMVIGCV